MLLAIAAVLGALLALMLYRRGSKGTASEVARDTTPVLERFLRDALERELAESVLGFANSTPEERRKLTKTLGDEPDADVVGKIEELVKAVELEFVRYPHETNIETTVRVRYEDGKVGTATRRLELADVPEGVKSELQKNATTRAFRTWPFPWQRIVAL
jgi:hypothetical protein